MNCIICDRKADATGSHIVPASLIQNCVGKHYREESYKIDSKNLSTDIYFGRDNLKNPSTEIKRNHYKRDYILCQVCEDNLAKIESNFSKEFLYKVREEKYKQNFKIFIEEQNLEILTPLKYEKEEFFAYLYSIIYRFCIDSGLEDDEYYIEANNLDKIKAYLKEYLYGNRSKAKENIKDFSLLVSFDKLSTNGSFIASSNEFKNPYMFFFCDPLLILFIGEVEEKAQNLLGRYLNTTNDERLKIVISPQFYELNKKEFEKYLAETYINKSIIHLCELNKKTYRENLEELNIEMNKYNSKENMDIIKVLDKLKAKYSS